MCQKCQAKANANTYYPQPNRGFQAPPSGAIPRQMPSSAPTNKQVDPPAPAAPQGATKDKDIVCIPAAQYNALINQSYNPYWYGYGYSRDVNSQTSSQQGYPQGYSQQGYPQGYQQGYPQGYSQQGYPQGYQQGYPQGYTR